MTPWTWKQFLLEMRRAGWRRDLTAGFFWRENNRMQFTPFNARRHSDGRMVEAWQEWAAIRQTPPPF